MLIVNQNPQEHTPAFNQMPWVFRETDVTDANINNWRLSVGVLRDGQLASNIGTVRLRFRAGSGGRCVFDPMRVIQSVLTEDHRPVTSALTPWEVCGNSIAAYGLIVASQFFDGSQWVAKNTFIPDRLFFAFNGVIKPVPFSTYTQSQVLSPCLTAAPTTQNIGATDSLWLHNLTNVADKPAYMQVRTYTGATLVNTYTFTNPFTNWTGAIIIGSTVIPAPINARRRTRVAVGTRDLVTYGVTFTGIDNYTATFYDNSSGSIGNAYTFNISTCAKYDPVRVHWLNRLGGFDAYTFKLKSRYKTDYTKEKFRKQHNVLDAGSYGYTSQSRGETTYHTEEGYGLMCNSDSLSDVEAAWMEDLLGSPSVYIENANGTFTAVTINNKQHALQKGVIDGVPFLELDLMFALKGVRQGA